MAFTNEDTTRKGDWQCNSNFAVADPVRPLKYAIDDYGWVQLGGWIKYTGGAFVIDPNNSYGVNDPFLFPAAITPIGIRDFLGCAAWGAVHLWTFQGKLWFRPYSSLTLDGNGWLSFDGCSYRL